MLKSEIEVSVVIITRNRSFILGDCLRALKPQIREGVHEVIVVDSSEADDTRKLIQEFPWVRYEHITLPLGTRPQSYSYGSRMAVGKIVALLDDDAIVEAGWLDAIHQAYDDDLIGAVGGRVWPKEGVEIPDENAVKPIGKVYTTGRIVSNLYLNPKKRIECDTLRGCNMSIRKDLLERAGYFDNRLRGQNCRVEDDVCIWVKRFGYKVIYEPKAIVRHLAEQRPDIPRSETNLRSEFYVWRNTVWLYMKHFKYEPKIMLNVALIEPIKTTFRRFLGGSFKRPRITGKTMPYFLPAMAAMIGGLWGIVMSLCYGLGGLFSGTTHQYPKIDAYKVNWDRVSWGAES